MQEKQRQNDESNTTKDARIYISIDHLKQGMYQLHLMCKEKIVKTIKFKK